jgi:hypothetical protein
MFGTFVVVSLPPVAHAGPLQAIEECDGRYNVASVGGVSSVVPMEHVRLPPVAHVWHIHRGLTATSGTCGFEECDHNNVALVCRVYSFDGT